MKALSEEIWMRCWRSVVALALCIHGALRARGVAAVSRARRGAGGAWREEEEEESVVKCCLDLLWRDLGFLVV